MPKSKVYTQQAKKTIHVNAHDRILAIGNKVEERAKQIIQWEVYADPETTYRRTGLAKASIHTVDKGNYVLVGANEPSFKEDASKLGVDVQVGGVTFYLPYIEKGHIMRNGEFFPARPFLAPALDWARQKWGK